MFARIERLEPMGTGEPGDDRIRTTIQRYFACIGAMDEESWLGLHARDAVCFAPAGAPAARSREELRRFFGGLWAAFDTLELEPDRIWTAPAGAAVKWTGRGIARNGRSVTFEGIDVFEVDPQARIAKVWSYWDPGELAAALGA
jgi:steroid Delta-isomerase